LQDLGTLGGKRSQAHGVNGAGWVVGWSKLAGSEDSQAVLWRSGGIRDLGTLGGRNSAAYGINANGIIVGQSELADQRTYHACIWDRNGIHDLNDLVDGLGRRLIPCAVAINDRGQVAGWCTIGGKAHACLLTPIGRTSSGRAGGGGRATVACSDVRWR
jgi:probable HAF family extracellular repeat protein